MSKRHRSADTAPVPKAEIRAHARGERHRINTELHNVAGQVSGGLEPDDVEEPGAEFKPVHHHDADKAVKKANGRRLKHWKLKDWKRRSTVRKARAKALRAPADEV
jgi:acyl-CoA reductase-like NAD-dependent aldehyde dehydrogenase